MATLAELNLSTVTTSDKSIVEPLGLSQTVFTRLENYFPVELYSHSRNGLLVKLLTTLVGDSGTDAYKKKMLYPRLSNSVFNTHFSDIDKFYGASFGFNRIEDEIYTFDPLEELITEEEWQEIRRKDSWYRARCLEFMRALKLGTTPEGLALACQAASGIECSVVERWRYLDDQASDESTGVLNIGLTDSRQEFVVVPHTPTLTPKQARRISNIMHRLKPINTIFTISPQEKPRVPVAIQTIVSTSQYFQARRLVTGNKLVKYPPVDRKTGLWIEPGVEKEAPNFAFGQTSEFVTWPTILSATSTSSQVGPFNKLQRELFPHLQSIPDALYQFDAEQAFSNVPVKLEITEPWFNRGDANVLVNNYFPLGLFADASIPNTTFSETKLFWASLEKEPPEQDILELDFNVQRNINYVEFEISTKPIRFDLQYQDPVSGTWNNVNYVYNDLIDNNREIVFTSSDNSWQRVQLVFEGIKVQKIRLLLNRQIVPFPYPSSPLFPWSIEVRGLRAASVVTQLSDFGGESDTDNPGTFVDEGGIDILGNSYRTVLEPDRYAPDKTLDGELDTYWQSQSNPSRFAVEALYLDIRDDAGNPSTIDELYIDPITAGCLMHVYWSNDEPGVPPVNQDLQDWRLWTPIPRHFTLTRGYHSLKQSVTAKYLKIEFTKLMPQPYRALDLAFRPVRYKTHPSWVQEYITKNQMAENEIPFTGTNDVTLNYVSLGVMNPGTTKLDVEKPLNIEDYNIANEETFHENFKPYQTWIRKGDSEIVRLQKEANVNIPLGLFTADLSDSITPTQFINKFLINQGMNDLFRPESPLVEKPLVNIASRNDRTLVEEEKNYPDMWFPRTVRHAYKILDAKRTTDIAYNVAIREIALYRADKNYPSDEAFYSDTFADDVNIEELTFDRADWRLIVSDIFLGEGSGSIGDEDFDVLTVEREVFT